jgi:hypothetical protein
VSDFPDVHFNDLGDTEYTEEDVRRKFLDHVRLMIGYWNSEDVSNVPATMSSRERLEGLAFSILVALDGNAAALPKFIVAPDPHPEDREFCQQRGERWYPENYELDVKADIAGSLHELLGSARTA